MRNLSAYDKCACGRDKAKQARMCISCRRDPLRTRPLSDRFAKRLPRPLPDDGCWEWQGKLSPRGYGVLAYTDTRSIRAHRLAWELTHGPIPEGMVVCHHCDNPRCVRLEHLFLGTQGDNIRDAARKGRLYTRRAGDRRQPQPAAS